MVFARFLFRRRTSRRQRARSHRRPPTPRWASTTRSPTRSCNGSRARVVKRGVRRPAGASDLLSLLDRVPQRLLHHRTRDRMSAPLRDRADEALDAEPGVLPGPLALIHHAATLTVRPSRRLGIDDLEDASTNALAEEASSRGFIQPARVRIAASDSRSSTAAGSPRRVPLSHTIAYVFPSNLARSLGVSRSSRTRTRRYAADVVLSRAKPFAHAGHCSSSSSYAIPWIAHRTMFSNVTSLDHLIRPH